MTLKSQKTRPKFFQDFQSSNQHGTVVKSPFFKKNVRFMGTVSGPAGCLCRVGLGFILILFKTLWFRFRLGSIEGWLFVYLGLVQDLFRLYLGLVLVFV